MANLSLSPPSFASMSFPPPSLCPPSLCPPPTMSSMSGAPPTHHHHFAQPPTHPLHQRQQQNAHHHHQPQRHHQLQQPSAPQVPPPPPTTQFARQSSAPASPPSSYNQFSLGLENLTLSVGGGSSGNVGQQRSTPSNGHFLPDLVDLDMCHAHVQSDRQKSDFFFNQPTTKPMASFWTN